ncbi:MAG: hypothetical protein ABW224_13555 [Kibdelosporangium sp.]
MTYPPGGSAAQQGQQSPPSTPQVAKDQAQAVGSTAVQSGEQVMHTVGDQTKRVVEETTRQARNLLDEGRQQLTEQARDSQQKAAQGLHTLADQLDEMRSSTDGSGIGPEVVHQAAGHARTAADWLENRQPGDLLTELRGFARRKPGLFLAGAAVAGILVGRLTRGVVTAQSSDSTGGAKKPADDSGPAHAADQYPPASYEPATAPQPVPVYSQPPAAPGYSQPPAPAYYEPPVLGGTAGSNVPPAWHGPGAGQS